MGSMLEPFRSTRLFRSLKKRAEGPLAPYVWLRLQGAAHYAAHGHSARRRAVAEYLSATAAPRLQLGSGPNRLPGWLNSDLVSGDIYVDVSRRLPLPSSAFAYVFCEHLIEHISEAAGVRLINEIHRVLSPGGVVRITTPDLRKIISLYEDRNDAISLADYASFLDSITGKEHERPCQVFNDFMRLWGHRYIYDQDDLGAKLEAAGFTAIERRAPGKSDHELLRRLEQHGPPWENDVEAMCIEATRR
jgi:predicted SAM-dependent methyltransferase